MFTGLSLEMIVVGLLLTNGKFLNVWNSGTVNGHSD